MGVSYIGYKGFDKDLKAFNGFQYEVGKTYEMEKEPVVGKIGFHFYNNLVDLLGDNFANSKRICIIKAYGDVGKRYKFDNNIILMCTNKIEILKEINISKIDRLKYRYSYYKDISYDAKALLEGKEKFDPNEMIKSKDVYLRIIAAEEGYGLDTLVNDKNYHVRRTIAKQGYALDTLINDENPRVRIAVAKQGYGLDKLVNDKSWFVRIAVARQGYGLDKLINDKDASVRDAAFEYIIENCPELKEKFSNIIEDYYK